MPTEQANVISALKTNWPTKADPKSQGDDHLRMLKQLLQSQFPDGLSGTGFKIPLSATTQQLNWVTGVTSKIQDQFDKITSDIGEEGLRGQVDLNTENIETNTTNIGSTTSGMIQQINTNTANIGDESSGMTQQVITNTGAIGDTNSGLTKDVKDNTDDISNVAGRMHLHAAGAFFGDTLGKLAGTNFTVSRVAGFAHGAYTVTMGTPTSTPDYVVTVSAGAISTVDITTSSTFDVVVLDTNGDPIDPAQVHFMVVDT